MRSSRGMDRFRLATGWALGLAAAMLLGPGCDTGGPTPDVGSVSGSVYARYTVNPIGGAHVACQGVEDVTDSQGRFLLRDVPRGPQEVTVEAPTFQTERSALRVDEYQSLRIELTPVDTLVTVSGQVIHQLEGPVVNAMVQIESREASTDLDGRWSLGDVPLGPHDLRISHANFVDYTRRIVLAGPVLDMQDIIQKETSVTLTGMIDAAIHWDDDDDPWNHFGSVSPVVITVDPRRSFLVGFDWPIRPYPITVVDAQLEVCAAFPDSVQPPSLLSMRYTVAYGSWFEDSVSVGNLPPLTNPLGVQDAPLLPYTIDAYRATIDVTAAFSATPNGEVWGVNLQLLGPADPPIPFDTRESGHPFRNPRFLITLRY